MKRINFRKIGIQEEEKKTGERHRECFQEKQKKKFP